MSPLRMHHNCGSSSRLVLRRKAPMGVRYVLGSCNKCVATAGVSSRMLRNFGILKTRLSRPTRSLQYSAGPFEVNRTSSANKPMGSSRTRLATVARQISNMRFISRHPAQPSSGLAPPSASGSSPKPS